MRLRRTTHEVFVGLDLSPGRIKLVGLLPGEGVPAVACVADEVLGTEDGGESVRFDPSAIGARVNAVLARSGVRPRCIALCLGPGESVARRMTVVQQDRDAMLAALSLQLGQALGVDVTAPRVAYVPLAAPAPQGRVTLFAAAARTEAVAAQQRAVAAGGNAQGPVTAAAAALVNAWRACAPRQASTGRVVLLHVGHTAALWIVLDGGEPVALDAPLVGVASVRDRARGGSAEASWSEWAGRLRQEIARGILPLHRASGAESAHEVWVSGGGVMLPGLLEALRTGLNAAVHVFEPETGARSAGPALSVAPALLPAFGAALQAMAEEHSDAVPLPVDLRVPTARPARAGRVPLAEIARSVITDRAYRRLAATTVVLWASTAFLGARVRAAEDAVREREARALADSAAVAGALSRSEVLQERRRGLGDRIEAAGRLDRGRYAWPRLLHGITRAVPPSAWVTDIVPDASDPAAEQLVVRIRGYAATDAVASQFAQGLVREGSATEAQVLRTAAVRIGRSPAVQFELSARVAALPDTGSSGGEVRP